MKYKIAIASGKGGTGKTTVSLNLFRILHRELDGRVRLVDCDVEEPNDMLFFSDAIKASEKKVCQLIPEVDSSKCTFCGKCVEYCEFNAISIIPSVKHISVDNNLCHSCGACLHACSYGAITEYEEPIGVINIYDSGKYEGIAEGRLKVGSAMQTMLIKNLKKEVVGIEEADVIIYDAPPGTSCPVVETISDVNYIILVAESTLFGLHDLKLMIQLVKEMKQPCGVVINKAGLGSDDIYNYLKTENIDLLGEIPFSKEYAGKYASGNIFENISVEIEEAYDSILTALNEKLFQHE